MTIFKIKKEFSEFKPKMFLSLAQTLPPIYLEYLSGYLDFAHGVMGHVKRLSLVLSAPGKAGAAIKSLFVAKKKDPNESLRQAEGVGLTDALMAQFKGLFVRLFIN